MTDFSFKKSIKPLLALLLTFFVAASFIMITHADDDEYGTTISAKEGDDTSSETTETQSSESSSSSTTKAVRPSHTARSTTQRVSRTNSRNTTAASTQTTDPASVTGEGTTSVQESDIPSNRRSDLTGVPHDYNRTSYNAPNPDTSAGSAFTTVDTGIPEITQETYQSGDLSIDFGGFGTESESYDESGTSAEETTSAQPNPAYRKMAAGFAAAAALLALGGAAFAVWYIKEQKAKEEQKDLYKF